MQHNLDEDQKGSLSKVEKTAWGLIGSSENILHNTTNIMANPILNIGLGVSPVLVVSVERCHSARSSDLSVSGSF